MTIPLQESQWVLQAQCDDRQALELLLRGVQPALHRYIRTIVGPSHADDVLQEVLMTICRKLKWLHTPELFRPWAYRIASRHSFRYLQKEKRWPQQPSEESVFEKLPAPPDVSLEHMQHLLVTEDISPASRAVLVLHFQHELPLAEIAAILGIPLGTVKSRLAYGLASIRKNLRSERSSK